MKNPKKWQFSMKILFSPVFDIFCSQKSAFSSFLSSSIHSNQTPVRSKRTVCCVVGGSAGPVLAAVHWRWLLFGLQHFIQRWRRAFIGQEWIVLAGCGSLCGRADQKWVGGCWKWKNNFKLMSEKQTFLRLRLIAWSQQIIQIHQRWIFCN